MCVCVCVCVCVYVSVCVNIMCFIRKPKYWFRATMCVSTIMQRNIALIFQS